MPTPNPAGVRAVAELIRLETSGPEVCAKLPFNEMHPEFRDYFMGKALTYVLTYQRASEGTDAGLQKAG